MTVRMSVTVLVALGLAGCGNGAVQTIPTTVPPATTEGPTIPPTTAPSASCSAADLEAVRPQDGLPGPVAAMRAAIAEAAVRCDYSELGRLALDGRDQFTATFGGAEDPAAFWMEEEADGTPVLARLVQVLAMSYGQKQTQFEAEMETPIYFWPAAFGDDPTEEDWEEVGKIYSQEEIAQMQEFGGYIGYRVGVTEDGDWVFFVAGD